MLATVEPITTRIASRILGVREGVKKLEGRVWAVTLIASGTSMNRNHYPEATLQKAVPMFQGCRVFDAHATSEDFAAGQARKPGGDYVGWIDNVHWNAKERSIDGDLHVADPDLRDKMLMVYEAGRQDEFGLSVDVLVDYDDRAIDGQQVHYVTEFVKVSSVDLVFDPSAGGSINHIIESTQRSEDMDKKELQEALAGLSRVERIDLLEMIHATEDRKTEAGRYTDAAQLPDSVRALKEDDQQKWMGTFNSNFAKGGDEQAAAKEAWASVRNAKEDAAPDDGTLGGGDGDENMDGKPNVKGDKVTKPPVKTPGKGSPVSDEPDREAKKKDEEADGTCPHCGAELAGGDFCPGCGKPVGDAEAKKEGKLPPAFLKNIKKSKDEDDTEAKKDDEDDAEESKKAQEHGRYSGSGSENDMVDNKYPGAGKRFGEDVKKLEHGVYQLNLDKKIKASRLPEAAQEYLYTILADRVHTDADVARTIEGQRKMLASVTPVKPSGLGAITGLKPVFGIENAELALARAVGVLEAYDDKEKKALEGLRRMSLREWYVNLTGDEDGIGAIHPRRLTEANVTTASVSNVVLNVLNKSLIREYNAAENKRWWTPIVANYDQETINDVTTVQTAGIASLPGVPEGAAYTELTWSDFKETGAFGKKGGFVGVTLETFMRDNLQALRRIPAALMRTYNYTISDLVSAVFTANSGTGPTLGTTSRVLVNVTEGNKATGAMTYANAVSTRQAFMKLTEFGSSRRLGNPPRFVIVPIDLEDEAIRIRDSNLNPDNADNPVNTLKGKFEIVTVPPFTNTKNWYWLADPKDIEVISLHWYRGQRTPQLFAADAEQTGALFTNDEIRYKVRFWVASVVEDWRGVYGNVVP